MSVPSNLVPTRILQLPEDPAPSDTGWMMYVNNGVTYKVQVNAVLNVSGVPTTRAIIAGAGLSGGGTLASDVTLYVTPGGIGSSELDNTGVTPGVYGSSSELPILTVDANGRVTAATTTSFSVSGYVPVTRQVIAGTGLSGGGALNNNVTLNAVFSSSLPLALGAAAAGVANVSAREDHVHPAVDLASTIETTGVLGMVSGGTGVAHTAPAAGSVAYSDGSGIQLTTVGLAGQVLVSQGAGAPDWGSALIVSDQPANYFYAGPTSGPDAPTAFRALVNADLPASGVSANTYGSASSVPVFAVNSKGVVTSVTNTTIAIGNSNLANSAITINGNSVSLGGSTTVTATATNALTIGTGLSGSSYNGSSAVTIAITNTGVTAASVGSASKTLTATVNAQGQLTALADTNIAISNTQVSGLGSAALLTAGAAGGVATLDGGGTVPTSQLPAAVLGALKYQGTWNASTNTPTLASGVGTQGYYYVVSVAGSTNLDGITTWAVGDWAIYSGTEWQKIDNTDAVTSVNGYTGTVVLTASDVGAAPALTYTSTYIPYGQGTTTPNQSSSLTFDGTVVSSPKVTLTAAGSATTGASQLYLNGATSNRIDWSDVGTGTPTFTTRSDGTKALLYPALSGSQVDYAIGINAATLWSSVPVNSSSFYFKWYGGETQIASLDGTGALAVSGTGLVGTNANFTDFPNAQFVASQANTGSAHIFNIGVAGEGVATDIVGAGQWGVGVYGTGATAGATRGIGVVGDGHVGNTADTAASIGVRGYATQTHAGGQNIGLYSQATGGASNYSLFMASGNIYSAVAQTWAVPDNEASALSIDTTGKSGILKVVTTNGAEEITMSGALTVTGQATFTTGITGGTF